MRMKSTLAKANCSHVVLQQGRETEGSAVRWQGMSLLLLPILSSRPGTRPAFLLHTGC